MTKQDIVKRLAEECGVDRNTAVLTVDKVLDSIKESVSGGEEVFLRGFGTFGVKTRAQKKARNIAAGTTVIIPEHDEPVFRPSQCFKDGVARKR